MGVLCMIGTTELLIIGGAVLLLFGGKKIPELMRSMGQGVRSFKQGMAEGLPEEKKDEEQSVAEKTEELDSAKDVKIDAESNKESK